MTFIAQVEVGSLKEACEKRLQEAILSGEFSIGARLPSERDLAKKLGVSRPVLHEAIVALGAQGLVKIEARRGVFVSDYRRESSIALLNTLLEYEEGDFNPELFKSLIAGRLLIERETARLAAQRATRSEKEGLQVLLEEGKRAADQDAYHLMRYDFKFHLEVALLSGNQMYPMILNSLRGVHHNLAGRFYRAIFKTSTVQTVLDYHQALVEAIEKGDEQGAATVMDDMLRHGEEQIIRIVFDDEK